MVSINLSSAPCPVLASAVWSRRQCLVTSFISMCAAKRLKTRSENYCPPMRQHVTEAAQLMPADLKRAAVPSENTYVATEVSDGNRTLFVVRGTVTVERR